MIYTYVVQTLCTVESPLDQLYAPYVTAPITTRPIDRAMILSKELALLLEQTAITPWLLLGLHRYFGT